MNRSICHFIVIAIASILCCTEALAHHVLGRPAYSLNEDSNTPPSMQVEVQIGDYYVTYMVYPAFPKPGDAGRINLYASRIDNGDSYDGEVSFYVRDDTWFGSEQQETLGTQGIDDGVYRQGFLFKQEGDYLITAEFESGGEPYVIDFPLQIGESGSMAPIGMALGAIVITLVGVNMLQRKRILRDKLRSAQGEAKPS